MAAAKPKKISKSNGEVFRDLIERNDLTIAEAAKLLRRPIKTLENWLSSPRAINHRKMHDDTLEIFRIRLREKTNG